MSKKEIIQDLIIILVIAFMAFMVLYSKEMASYYVPENIP